MKRGSPAGSGPAREERRAQILGAAVKVFGEKGLHSTTVTEIAALAGVSQGTVYLYFDSKEALFEAAFLEQFDAVAQPFFEIVRDESRAATDRLAAAAELLIDLFSDEPELAFLMLQVMAMKGVAAVVAYDFREYYDRFHEVLEPLFAEIGDPDPAATSALYMGLLDGLMLQRALMPDLADRAAVMEQLREKFNLQDE